MNIPGRRLQTANRYKINLKGNGTMSLSEENSSSMVMPVGPIYGGSNGGGNNGFGFGGDWAWILLLLVLFGNNGWGGMGMDGGLYPWLNNSQNINGGFRDQMLNTGISSIGDKITSGFGDIQTALCGGFGNVQNSLCAGFAGVNAGIAAAQNGIAQQLYANQLADLERSFAAQTASTQGMTSLQAQLAQCCCDNRAATADLKYTVATENCADRAAVTDALREVIAANTASTQRILDQLCADKIEQKNDIIAQLRSELMYARGQASQDVQTAAIQAGQRALASEVEAYVAPRPIPAYYVQNPNCCGNFSGCGCAA